ncbi:MAG: hypothetical protein MZV64_19680 [Ignavibacteriales bacterium]|nr:hypothetical protein [Ignavibacteriales bacterium]
MGSPIVGSSLALPLKLAGYRAHCLPALQHDGRLPVWHANCFASYLPRSSALPDMMDRDLSRHDRRIFPAFSIASLRRTDLRPMLDADQRSPRWACTATGTLLSIPSNGSPC